MVFDRLKRLFKFLFSRLFKESKLFGHEKKLEGQERDALLTQEIDEKQILKLIHEGKGQVAGLEVLERNVLPFVAGLESKISRFLSSGEEYYLSDAGPMFQKVVLSADKINEKWNGVFDTLKKVAKTLNWDKGQVEKEIKVLRGENKILRRHLNIVRAQASHREDLDENEKFANIKKRRQINAELETAGVEKLELIEGRLKSLGSVSRGISRFVKEFGNLKDDLHKNIKNWRLMGKILRRVGSKFGEDKSIIASVSAFFEGSQENDLAMATISKKTYVLQERERLLTTVEGKTLVNEEIKMQEGPQEVPRAA